MKIAKAESIWVATPFRNPGPPSGFGGTTWNKVSTLLIRLETEDGLVGWGEAFGHNAIPATKAAFDHQIAPLVVGRDATRISALMTELQKLTHNFGRYGQTMFAFSGLDTMKQAYAHAVEERYRFYSYGDACLLSPAERL